MNEPIKICIQRAETRQEWDEMQADYIRRALLSADRIQELEAALSHIWAWYPISVAKPHETIDAIKDYAFAAIKGEKKDE